MGDRRLHELKRNRRKQAIRRDRDRRARLRSEQALPPDATIEDRLEAFADRAAPGGEATAATWGRRPDNTSERLLAAAFVGRYLRSGPGFRRRFLVSVALWSTAIAGFVWLAWRLQ